MMCLYWPSVGLDGLPSVGLYTGGSNHATALGRVYLLSVLYVGYVRVTLIGYTVHTVGRRHM